MNVVHFLRKYTYNKNIFAKVISNVVQIEFYFYVLILSQEVQSFQYCSNLFNVNKWREKSIGSSIRFLSYQFLKKESLNPSKNEDVDVDGCCCWCYSILEHLII